jgi:hypothetical protein
MKKFKLYQTDITKGDFNSDFIIEADFIYAQPSGTSTLHRCRPGNPSKSDIVAVVPANLLILEV